MRQTATDPKLEVDMTTPTMLRPVTELVAEGNDPQYFLEHNKQVYRRFIDILNQQTFDFLPEVVNPDKYHEICVGFTPGRVNLTDAITSLKKVLVGIPDLYAQIDDCVAEGNKVYARITVRGTNAGPFYGLPALHQTFHVNMFDYVELEDGKIVERVQQSDTVSQLRQMYTRPLQRFSKLIGGIIVGVSAVALIIYLVQRAHP
jgi:steroid delta-isomerase-like uncharacterized protein